MLNSGINDMNGREIVEGDILILGDIGAWQQSKVWVENDEFYVNDDGSKLKLQDAVDTYLASVIIDDKEGGIV